MAAQRASDRRRQFRGSHAQKLFSPNPVRPHDRGGHKIGHSISGASPLGDAPFFLHSREAAQPTALAREHSRLAGSSQTQGIIQQIEFLLESVEGYLQAKFPGERCIEGGGRKKGAALPR